MTLRILLLFPLLTFMISCGGNETPEEPLIRPVRFEQVFATGAGRARSFSGTAEAGLESRLSFRVAGSVRELLVNVGDRVRANDPIARLDPTDYELRVEDAEASVSRYQAESRQAAANYERIRQLYENRNASRSDLDAARAASEAAAAAVTSGEKNLEMARVNLGYTTLRAPVDGAISSVPVETNENVNPGAVIAVLTSGSQPEVQITVPEALIGRIREGDAVTAQFDAVPQREFPATVTEVGISASRGGATFPVRVRLDDETSLVRPGMAAEVTFSFGATDDRDRIYLPASSILEDRDGRFAFVLDLTEPGFGLARRRAVEIGELTADGLQITRGIEDGDLVVTAGVTKIQDGMRVRVPGTETPTP